MKESAKKRIDEQQQILHEIVDRFYAGDFFSVNLAAMLPEVPEDKKVWLLGAGKASVDMARQVEDFYGEQIVDGMVIAPEAEKGLSRIQVFKGTHPYPDEDSISSSYELMQLASHIPEEDQVIFCLSGGASALFSIPAGNIEPEDLGEAYRVLLRSGASIHDINTVRRHITKTGGGKLGQLLASHNLHSFLLSDVPGDGPHIIGSGPTVADPTTFKEAFQKLKHHQLWEKMPHSVRIHISKGMHGNIPENPKPGEVDWPNHKVEVISAPKENAQQIGTYLSDKGWHVQVEPEAYDDSLRKVSKKMCGDAISVLRDKSKKEQPAAFIYYGESTVQVQGSGKGGRNLELALNAAISLEGQHPVSVLSLATDGVDGPTDAAGAIVDSQTTLAARKQKLDPEKYLQDNDSYHFHEKAGTIIKKGPTGNNLMDLQVVLVG
ncbi:glycerate kinase type-2 family protein [Gracilimonas mengyeensis]|uniref:Glycerate 2-kinase n=1 Tax=Gracilimonas mengyeensis TaxID=1302730 RepID=A0A521DZX8_9BACT|nr:DUF4147 domain-containing protein [Gracilimonas mengyeensis]SMO77182.1 glycerate 2-kinase [Gracilimonas mengyeensis]